MPMTSAQQTRRAPRTDLPRVPGRNPARFWLLPLLMLFSSAIGCRATVPKEPPLDPMELGTLEDVLSGPVVWDSVVGTATLLALGQSAHVERLLAWRAARAAEARQDAVLVDASGLEPAALQALEDSLVLAAVDPGGVILIDREGRWVRRLAGPAELPVVVDFLPDGRVGLRSPLAP